ncbi:MAG: hypothetical protein EPN21_14690 [Methylococcaceae bacterium]|nr:MAG: hypothetical protein EPN21_14690 [Methylococcaceae bacterium]
MRDSLEAGEQGSYSGSAALQGRGVAMKVAATLFSLSLRESRREAESLRLPERAGVRGTIMARVAFHGQGRRAP